MTPVAENEYERVRRLLRQASTDTDLSHFAPTQPDEASAAASGDTEHIPLPAPPQDIPSTGLRESFLIDLTLKTLYVRGQITIAETCEALKLPYPGVMEPILRFVRDEMLVEIRKGTTTLDATWEIGLTKKGAERARDILSREGYVGPAPVSLDAYCQMVERQPTSWRRVDERSIRETLGDLVVSDETLARLGPAFNSGKSMFLYGNAGNGKTLISERMAGALHGGIIVPYAIEASGQVIRFFDGNYHRVIRDTLDHRGFNIETPSYDERWLLVRRPFIVVGGELKLENLDLTFDDHLKYYIAPVQMKANGGALMIDDFGRQQVPPRDLLNRWIVPLEKNIDYHTLVTGQQVAVPFQVLVIFSTNLEPRDLVEEAFLRRIRYKVEIGDPSEEDFRKIFRNVCASLRLEHNEEALDYLIERHYRQENRGFRAVHPRDLLMQLMDIANYRRIQPQLTPELLDAACRTYFIDL